LRRGGKHTLDHFVAALRGLRLVVAFIFLHGDEVSMTEATGEPGHDAEFSAFLAEVFGDSDRACAVVAAAHVEDTLAEALEAKFRPLTPDDKRILFEGLASPLSSFHAKIHIAYAISLLSKAARDDLLVIKDVRNLFAHHIKIRRFSHPDVVKKCNQLHYPATKAMEQEATQTDDARGRFQETVGTLFLGLGLSMSLPENSKRRIGSRVFNGLLHYDERPTEPATSPKKARVRPSRGQRG